MESRCSRQKPLPNSAQGPVREMRMIGSAETTILHSIERANLHILQPFLITLLATTFQIPEGSQGRSRGARSDPRKGGKPDDYQRSDSASDKKRCYRQEADLAEKPLIQSARSYRYERGLRANRAGETQTSLGDDRPGRPSACPPAGSRHTKSINRHFKCAGHRQPNALPQQICRKPLQAHKPQRGCLYSKSRMERRVSS